MTTDFAADLALGTLGAILVAIAVWLSVVHTGAYNVAASDHHFHPVRWTFDTTPSAGDASGEPQTEASLQ